MAVYCRSRKCRFYVDGQPQPVFRVLSPELFLPVIALQAELGARQMFGREASLGTEFVRDDDALLGVFARVAPIRADDGSVLRALLFTHALNKVFGIADEAHIECAPVYNEYRDGAIARLAQGAIKWPLADMLSPR